MHLFKLDEIKEKTLAHVRQTPKVSLSFGDGLAFTIYIVSSDSFLTIIHPVPILTYMYLTFIMRM